LEKRDSFLTEFSLENVALVSHEGALEYLVLEIGYRVGEVEKASHH